MDLQKTNSKTIRREVELKLKKDKLLVPAKRENRSLPKFEENILTLSHNTIANMAEAISLRSDYYFKTNINSQKTYQFTIDLSSYESIKESLECYGFKLKEGDKEVDFYEFRKR